MNPAPSQDGSGLTKACFVKAVGQALSCCGVSLDSYSGHSFRIGAATVVAQAGIQDSII